MRISIQEANTPSQRGLVPNDKPLPKCACWQLCCNPLCLGLAFCCIGLAINRAYIRTRIDETAAPRFPLDMCLFMLCGYCVMTRDLAVAFPGQDRSGTEYSSKRYSCLCPEYFCHFSNCLVCCFLAVLPFPCYCCLQAYVTHNANEHYSFLKACLRPIFCCCFGFALNRAKISQERNHKRYFCYDCLVYAFPLCCCCSIMQEYLEDRNRIYPLKAIQ